MANTANNNRKNNPGVKILIFGDRHNCEVAPISRIDDYFAACEEKDNFIIELARKNHVDAFIQPGDFWTDADRKPTNEFVGRVASKWLASGIPVIGIPGNHDLIGGDPESLPKTACGLLNTLGLFKTLVSGEEYHIKRGDIDVCITGTPYHNSQDKPECVGDYIVGEKRGDYHVHIAHGMLTPTDLGPKIRHTTIHAICGTAADVTVCGHDHGGFGVVEASGKLFVNPGAVMRMSCRDSEYIRTPSVVLVTFTPEGVSYQQIDLPAKPASEVLTRDHVEEERQKQQFATEVQQSVKRMQLGGTAIQSILEEIYRRDSIPADVRNELKTRIESNTASLKNRRAAPENANIVRVTLHNFQSHANTTIELNDGLNVVLGESHAGKSAMLRGIRWVAENKPAGRSMLRKDADECFAEITLANGTVIRRFLNSNDNGYRVTLPSGQVMSGNTKMVDTIQHLMGWNSMTVGLNEEIGINHLSQSASPTLIGDRYSGTDRSRIIGAINNTDGCDEAVDQYALENNRLQEAKKYATDKASELDAKASECVSERDAWNEAAVIAELAVRREQVERFVASEVAENEAKKRLALIAGSFDEKRINAAIQEIERLADLRRRVAAETHNRDEAHAALESARQHCEALAGLADIENGMKQIDEIVTRRDAVAVVNAEYAKQVKTLAKCMRYKTPIDGVRIGDMDSLIDLCAQRETIAKSVSQLKAADQTISSRKNDLVMLQATVETACALEEATEANRTRSALSTAYMAYRSASQSLAFKQSDVEKAQTALDEKRTTLATALSEAHVCPVCGTLMDEEAIAKAID